jgi:ABC-type dipeptide/oligopeptide/nickel transport system permease component
VLPQHSFSSHVFHHIYLNARYQYLPALKEHASFLITGLIIIEMALNIQGHLCYELLQNVLFRQYDVVVAIILGIFLVVKTTEIIVDAWHHHEVKRYENR